MSGENPTPSEPPKNGKKKKRLRIIVIIVGILIVIRLILPYIVLHFVNDKLAHLDGYYGHVRDVDLALYRGAYVIKDVYIKKVDKDKKDTTDFFNCPVIDLSVQWKAIFEKKVVAEIEFEKPVIKYTMDKTIGKKAEKDTTDFIQLVKDLVPIRINRFAIAEGQIHYVDHTKSPGFDIPLTSVMIEASNLTNKPDPKVLLPSTIDMKGKLYDGSVHFNVHLDPLNKVPTFDLNGELTQTNLTHINPFFTAYANFDVKKGTMSMYTEFAASSGNFKGYVKPLIKDLDVVQFNKEEGNVVQIAWEALIGSVAEVFQNQKKDQLATKVPVEGKFTKPDVGVIEAIFAVLGNAFVSALKPTVDNTINIASVKNVAPEKKKFLDRVFNNKKKRK